VAANGYGVRGTVRSKATADVAHLKTIEAAADVVGPS